MIQKNVSLQGYNSLQLEAKAAYFSAVESDESLLEALTFARTQKLPILALGGGSNIVLADDFPGLALKLDLRGVKMTPLADRVQVSARAGEPWHEFVLQTLTAGCYGLENLSLIPGSVGAAPIQNIGAYGVEVKDCLYQVRAVELATGVSRLFNREECQFGYRDSIFKHALKDQFIITDVVFELSNRFSPCLEYGPLQQFKGQAGLTAIQLAEYINQLRREKLPDPERLGNAGCFFKNPVVSVEKYQALLAEFPDLVAFPFGDQFKLAAGWLIDQAGLKGLNQGAVGVYEHQALVLVNRGGARGDDLLALAQTVRAEVLLRYGVSLEFEPRIYP